MKTAKKGLELMEDDAFHEITNSVRGMLANSFCQLTIARSHYRMGELSEAATILEKMTDMFKEMIAFKRIAVNILGDVYRFMDRSVEAEQMHWEIEPIQRELHATGAMLEVAWYLKVENALVQLLEMNGKQTEADKLIPRALEHAREMIKTAPNYWDILLSWSIHNYARFLNRSGKLEEAEAAYHEILEIWRKHAIGTPDFGNPMIAHTLNNIALLQLQVGRMDEAEQSYRDAYTIIVEAVSKNPEGVFLADLKAAILTNLAVLLMKSERVLEAEKALIEALDVRKALFAIAPTIVGEGLNKTLTNLNLLYLESNRLDDAKDMEVQLKELGYVDDIAQEKLCIKEEELKHPWFR